MFEVEAFEGSFKIGFAYAEPREDGTKGRCTECYIESGDDIISAYAYCHPEDAFNKAVGRKIALTRALRAWKFNKKLRTKIWKQYLTLVK